MIVGAGAVVINSIPSNSVAVGVPTRVIKDTKLKNLKKPSVCVYYGLHWEMECCGEPFKVRDKIDWIVNLDTEFEIDKFKIDLTYDGHGRAIVLIV